MGKSFEIALRKGQLGEEFVREKLESKGWIAYLPFTKDKAHYFDIMATKNKEQVIAIDVKTKARFNKWPAQGIDTKSLNEYLAFANKTNVPFWLIFVDDKSGDVHGQNILKLSAGFNPTHYITAWMLDEMKLLFNIGKERVEQLSKLDQRNHLYLPTDGTTCNI